MKINNLNINKNLISNVIKKGYNELTPIQEKVIPLILDNKDVIGIAKTGSGKTLAYGIPLINRAYCEKNNPKVIRSLILVPTRELAMQVRNEINSVSYDYVRTSVVMGGIKQDKQIHDIRKGIDILVATPGRLNDLLKQKKVSLATVDKVVLDEADTMLDMGFIRDIEMILSKTLSRRQTLLFTATYGDTIKKFVAKNLNKPTKIEAKTAEDDKGILTEELYFIEAKNKNDFLLSYLANNRIEQALIFTRTKKGADVLCKFLNDYNLKTEAIHSDKRQGQRSRSLKDFKEGKINYLIATDIAARGIDVKDLPYVINYNLPDQKELYVHRIGRTARAGESGKAISICSLQEKMYLKDIEEYIGRKIPLKVDKEYSIKNKKFY
jgi:ATP-dependent RNA helicase RhlE